MAARPGARNAVQHSCRFVDSKAKEKRNPFTKSERDELVKYLASPDMLSAWPPSAKVFKELCKTREWARTHSPTSWWAHFRREREFYKTNVEPRARECYENLPEHQRSLYRAIHLTAAAHLDAKRGKKRAVLLKILAQNEATTNASAAARKLVEEDEEEDGGDDYREDQQLRLNDVHAYMGPEDRESPAVDGDLIET
ncbi:hypothetical protein AURDEDRAFT_178059 [Auricularia subglabra TFB-10046 SS5]|uniref:Uncharacterized protein n=1 Tax=Auricularia subglabra (strain TFB-10046 / SS5) TaxID=717982 RepID=J0WKL2_AURST|nr:hypothetical protein AURDEDRAFT_178059 [Auricularia subglabra TFB-10046 SS5]